MAADSFLSTAQVVCPPGLLDRASGKAAAATAVVGADHVLALESVRQAQQAGLITPTLIGSRAGIEAVAQEIDWDVSGFEVIEAEGETAAAEAGAQLASSGAVAMVMKGHVHSDTFMRPLLAKEGGIRGEGRLSHVFHMTVPGSNQSVMLTDCALNVAPRVKTRIAIVENVVALAHKLDIQNPHVALLAASESVSEAMPVTQECEQIAAHFAASEVSAEVFGPLAFDNIVSGDAAKMKGIDHPVAGRADVVVVPNIETGNALFKMMVYFMSACAAGIVLGGKVPVLLTSRADPPAARLASAALGAISAK
jgi:phosphate acetyltransferase